jgi:hypothetical protein
MWSETARRRRRAASIGGCSCSRAMALVLRARLCLWLGEEGGEQPEAESLSRRCRFAFFFLGCNWMHGYFRRFLEASGEHGTEISSL